MCIRDRLQGENVLLSGGKATGKNILADNLAWLFARPVYTCLLYTSMGVYGAGLATALGSAVSFLVMLTHFASRKNTLCLLYTSRCV